MTRFKLYSNSNENIGYFEGDAIFITEREKEFGNNIDAVSMGALSDTICIQLAKEPTMVTLNRWNNLWIGEPYDDNNKLKILYPILTHDESTAMEVAEALDGIGVK